MFKYFKWVPGFVAGLAVSSVAAFAHADRTTLAGYKIHYGLVLAPLLLLVTQRWVMDHYKNRISGIAFGIAWLLVTIRLSVPNSEGDVAIAANWYSTYYLGISALLLSMSAVVAPRSQRETRLENLESVN